MIGDKELKVLLFYGLPCTGKSSVIKELEVVGYNSLSVDNLIRKKVSVPSIEDFIENSPYLVNELIHIISKSEKLNISIEMGCLITKKSILILEEYLTDNKKTSFKNIILEAPDSELIMRAVERNKKIDEGLSNALKINNPHDIQKFIDIFEINKPSTATTIETTNKTAKQISKEIPGLVKKKS